MRFAQVPLNQIGVDPKNVRRYIAPESVNQMADSIGEYGLLENLVLKSSDTRPGFDIVAGERRYRGMCELVRRGILTDDYPVNAVISDGDGTFENLVENLCREDVSVWDLGFRFNELAEIGYTQREIGARIGKSQGMVSRCSAIAKGLHPASVDRLNRMQTKLTSQDLMRVASLLDADKKPDEKAQLDLIEEMAGTRKHRKKRKAKRLDSDKMLRRLVHLRDVMRVPSHALPYVKAIVGYLTGEVSGRSIKFPEEF